MERNIEKHLERGSASERQRWRGKREYREETGGGGDGLSCLQFSLKFSKTSAFHIKLVLKY